MGFVFHFMGIFEDCDGKWVTCWCEGGGFEVFNGQFLVQVSCGGCGKNCSMLYGEYDCHFVDTFHLVLTSGKGG